MIQFDFPVEVRRLLIVTVMVVLEGWEGLTVVALGQLVIKMVQVVAEVLLQAQEIMAPTEI